MNEMEDNYQVNPYKNIDIIKESKSTPTGCYFDESWDVAERKDGFENTATERYLDFRINYGLRRVTISFRLTAARLDSS